MKPVHAIISGVLLVNASAKPSDQEILPWDSLNSEKGWRKAIEERFPDLHFKCYSSNGAWFMGILEDFDHHRIFLMTPTAVAGSIDIARNDQTIPLPLKDEVVVKVAGAVLTPNGTESDPEYDLDYTLGYWLPLEATDRLRIEMKLGHPAEGTFLATYDPDNHWNLETDLGTPKRDRREPADAYEISRRPLLNQVIDTIAKKGSCTVRMRDGTNLLVEKADSRKEAETEPLRVLIAAKTISIGPPDKPTMLTLPEFNSHLTEYLNATRAAGTKPGIALVTDDRTSDVLFRKSLGVITELGGFRVAVLEQHE